MIEEVLVVQFCCVVFNYVFWCYDGGGIFIVIVVDVGVIKIFCLKLVVNVFGVWVDEVNVVFGCLIVYICLVKGVYFLICNVVFFECMVNCVFYFDDGIGCMVIVYLFDCMVLFGIIEIMVSDFFDDMIVVKEIFYLMWFIFSLFDDIEIGLQDVVFMMIGICLLQVGGVVDVNCVNCDYWIVEDCFDGGMFFVLLIGGKWMIFCVFGEQVVDWIF